MGKKKKELCKLDKDYIKNNLDEIISLTQNPQYICRKCARVSNDPECLCKVVRMVPDEDTAE